MNAPPSDPGAARAPKRYRWLIAAAVSVLLLLLHAGWSVRSSRRDPRLVGRWQPGSGATHWLLNADGTFCLITDDSRVVKTTQEWYVHGGQLYLTPAGGYWTGISKDLRNYRLQGKVPPAWPTFDIVSISSNSLVLKEEIGR